MTNIVYDYPPSNLASGTVDAPEGGIAPLGFNLLDVPTPSRLGAIIVATSSYSTFAAALAAGTHVIVNSAVIIDDDLTISRIKSLEVWYGASITVASGKTLTIRGPFNAAPIPIFQGDGIVLGIRAVYPEWWGSALTGTDSPTTDDILPLEKAHTCVQGSQATLFQTAPTIRLTGTGYYISRTWGVYPTANIGLQIKGNGNIFSGTQLHPMAAFSGGGAILHVHGQADSIQRIADWGISALGVGPGSGGIGSATIGVQIGDTDPATGLIGVSKNIIEKLYVSGFPTLLKVIHAKLLAFEKCGFWNNNYVGENVCVLITQAGSSTTEIDFNDCEAVSNSAVAANTYGVHILSNNGAFNPANADNCVANVKWNKSRVYAGQKAFFLQASSGSLIGDIWIQAGSQIDQSVTNALDISATGVASKVQNVNFLDSYTNACLGDAFTLTESGTSKIDGVTIHNNDCTGHQAKSLNAAYGIGVSFAYNKLRNQNNNTGSAMYIGPGCRGVDVLYNKLIRMDGTSSVQNVVQAAAGSDHYSIVGNNGGAAWTVNLVLNTAAGADSYVAGNLQGSPY